MSHELRTPLNAILGFGQLLEMDALNADQHESVEHILKGGRHLLELINEVLDIARIEAGRLSLSLEPVGLREVVDESLDLMIPLAAQRGIALRPDLATCERQVQADRQKLKQVLLNLLSNAVKYTERGGTVWLTCTDAAPARARIAVRDTGRGIAPEQLDRLFLPFERLGAETTTMEGTGLGLALSKRLAEAMGGILGVDSLPGQGSTFWLDLPAAPDEGPSAAGRDDGERTGAAEGTPAAAKTVVYIEDNLANLTLIEHILAVHRPGVTLVPAMQGSLGVEIARQHHPHLILLDLNLPDAPGDEVLRWLQADPLTRDISVVVLSADASPGQVERLLAAGARAFLTKPLEVKGLLALLDESLPVGAP